jgi:hypothetical protein
MLGFATVDLSIQDNTLTVWLTSGQSATDAGHTNAVTFTLGDDTTPRRALGMICDRYVVLTDRTPGEHPLLIGWGVEPCDPAMLAKQPPPRRPPSWPHSRNTAPSQVRPI